MHLIIWQYEILIKLRNIQSRQISSNPRQRYTAKQKCNINKISKDFNAQSATLVSIIWHVNKITYKKATFFNVALHQATQSQLNWSLQRKRVRNLTKHALHYSTACNSFDNIHINVITNNRQNYTSKLVPKVTFSEVYAVIFCGIEIMPVNSAAVHPYHEQTACISSKIDRSTT